MDKKEKQKEYRELHKEHIKQLKKIWYDKNRDKILEKRKNENITEEIKEKRKNTVKKWKNKNRDKINNKAKNIEVRYNKAKNRAKKKGIEWKLTIEEFLQETQKSCFYCENKLGKQSIVGVGLDRKDSKIGYISTNVCSCCSFCNTKKSNDLTPEETKILMNTLICIRKLHQIAAPSL